ncbi:feruloyl-CoA synthase [soil metagenome]
MISSDAWFTDPAWLAPQRVVREDLADGAFVLRSPEPLQKPTRCIGDWLERWSRETPDALFLAERAAGGDGRSQGRSEGWRTLSYGAARRSVGAVAQWLLEANLPAGKPVVVLSDNAIDHAVLMLAALHVGRPVCTVSSAYSRLAANHAKLGLIIDALDPALVYASDAATYRAALNACTTNRSPFATVLSTGAQDIEGALAFDALLSSTETPAVAAAFDAIRPEHHAKYLLTSGSTGHPKVVINTHSMLCSNQQMIRQLWRFLEHEKPIVLDWLPWSHTFGANHNFNMVLANGGALYIDDGRPMPGLIDKTIGNIREVRPTLYFNVPSGLDALATAMESDDELAHAFFGRLRALFYAGAALPQSTWARLEAVARHVRSEPVWFTSAWGSTETSPLVTSVHWRIDAAGCIGLPAPGMELKFVPNGGKLEMRVRGPAIFPGYLNAAALTEAAFDEDGYYLIGDAGMLVDEARPELGIAFDGRVAEDFKLTTGTWVSVGTLRLKAISALTPLAQDIVITGQDRDEIGLLIFPSPQARALSAEELATRIGSAMTALGRGAGSSQRPVRALVLQDPPDVAAGEITDKGYLNQRAILARRSTLVELLYSDDEQVIRVGL